MAALIRAGFVLVSLLAGGAASALCDFEDNEIINPLDPDCGDRKLTFVQSATGDPDDVPLGYPVPIPMDSTTPFDGFRTYRSLFVAQQEMMLLNPEVEGTIIGSTLSGEDIWAYRIGTPAQETVFDEPKGSVLINGGIHAREWQTPEVLAETFERLVAGRHDGGFVQYLVDNLAVYLIPVHNVDGFKQTQDHPDSSTAHPAQPRDGRMRRKNLAVSSHAGTVDADLATVPDNFEGVDLNRNHPIGFRAQVNNSRTTSLIYAGSGPHSEPESQALVAAAELADPERLRMYIDVHSFSQIYFTPQTGNAARDQNTGRLATAMRAVTNNKYRYSPDAAGTDIGTTASWFAGTFQVPAWTLETEPLNGPQDYDGLPYGHGGFVAPDVEIARIRDELARTLMLGFYRQAGPPSIVAAEVRDAAGSVVWSMDWRSNGDGTRTQEIGVDDALEPGGDYTLWVAFDKPMRWREGGAVAQFAGQNTPLAPTVALEYRDGDDITRIPITTEAADWRDEAGPEGLLNYADDAFAVEFTVPADAPATATDAVFAVEAADMTGFNLDVEPDTVAGWSNGAWTGYEGVDGPAQVIASGPDCSLRLWIGGGTRGDHTLVCSAREEADPDPPPNPPRDGGGGGVFEWAFSVLFSALLLARRSVQGLRRVRQRTTSGR